jgi:hypothetical protein
MEIINHDQSVAPGCNEEARAATALATCDCASSIKRPHLSFLHFLHTTTSFTHPLPSINSLPSLNPLPSINSLPSLNPLPSLNLIHIVHLKLHSLIMGFISYLFAFGGRRNPATVPNPGGPVSQPTFGRSLSPPASSSADQQEENCFTAKDSASM